MALDSLRTRWAQGETAYGVACVIPSAFSAEVLAHTQPDFLMVDRQHGPFGHEAVVSMLQAVSRTDVFTFVRVPPDDSFAIGSSLDAGASGIIVPMVNSREQAESAAAACRYPPRGTRSFGPLRASMLLAGSPNEVNDQVVCIVMIETVAGIEAADEICSCPGIDGVWVGEADLAIDMGVRPGEGTKEVDDAVAAVRQACVTNNVMSMALTGQQPELIQRRQAEGYQMLFVATDYQLLRVGLTQALRR